MAQIHRVLRCLLGMARKADGPDVEIAPASLIRQIRGQAPLRLSSPYPPPSEDQAENFLCLEDSQLRGLGWVGIGSGDALAGCIVLIAMEGTDEPATGYAASRGGPQIGAQVRTKGLGDTDAPVIVTLDDDVFAHPGLLDELGLQYGLTACDEVPALGKWGKQWGVHGHLISGCYRSKLLNRPLGLTASLLAKHPPNIPEPLVHSIPYTLI